MQAQHYPTYRTNDELVGLLRKSIFFDEKLKPFMIEIINS